MRRGGFEEGQFVCSICGERFTALCGPEAPRQVVCMHCGLRYSPAQREKRADHAARKRRPQ